MTESLLTVLMSVGILSGYAQTSDGAVRQEREFQKDVQFFNQKSIKDDREVVGVAAFKSDTDTPFASLVTEKVVETLKNSNRFIVVDRTNRDKVNEEVEYQKHESFIGQNVVEQGNSLAAKKLIVGTITKIPVYRIKNNDGSVRGYKASVAFQLKVDDVETLQTTVSTSFEAKASNECVSPQAAVQMAMNSLEPALGQYFKETFPLNAQIVKIISEKNGKASMVLLKAGKRHGVNVGDIFDVYNIEMINGEELHSTIGTVIVEKLSGEIFSECKVDRKASSALFEQFNANGKLRCTLKTKK